MEEVKTLVFDVWGEWGHFRKYYSTSSPLTYSMIPPTAVFGIIGAIIGLDKEDNVYLKVLNEAKTLVGVGLQRPVRKTSLGINHINTKGDFWVPLEKPGRDGPRTQIRTQFLRNPHFRLFVTMQDQALYKQLVEQVRNHRSFYTISLGLSENLANFGYVAEIEAQKKVSNGESVSLHSAIPVKLLNSEGLSFVAGNSYGKERLPISMNEDRIVSAYEECLIETKGQDIVANVSSYWEGDSFRFLFLNELGVIE